ncbi:hypothetical protein BJV74DRAFT_883918 [Russula compacta]|nr:hypothetical protein BJV74DRAFT_883918 [Russula compacta]
MSLMLDSLAFAPTLEIQHFRLVAMPNSCEKLPLDYASHQVHEGQLEQAIETLERGRGLLWSEMRGLRTSLHQLQSDDSPLAAKIAAINRDLEALTMSGIPSIWMNDDEIDGGGGMDPFGCLVVKQRELIEERDRLIPQIQTLPGFESFLKVPFDTLCSAAASGPVIIINHCKWRSDILILFCDSSPILIPTTNDFYIRANGLSDQLPGARKKGLDSREYAEVLRSLYFSDLYIHSYTPILSALVESRKPGAQTLSRPSLLLVARPDASLPGKMQQPPRWLRASRIINLSTFACHGTVEDGKPFNASFELHGDERLTLLDIVRSRLPAAEFAFLSVCHTAELTEESVADEGLHLAAAVQFCGFRSVV